jgi:hypothetical protein
VELAQHTLVAVEVAHTQVLQDLAVQVVVVMQELKAAPQALVQLLTPVAAVEVLEVAVVHLVQVVMADRVL